MGYEIHIRKEIMHLIKVFLSLFYLYDVASIVRTLNEHLFKTFRL